jgi:2,4-dienoyl-CoA reductase-like NADH-dependent reductase (Old Yellow Enzyme family)/NADH dehydrogenase FAD-containing subunit
MSPMATHLAYEDGTSSEALKDYYEERAAGGVSMITLESCYISPNGRGGIRRLGLYKDSQIPGLKMVTDAIHKHDAKICCQLHHGGPQCKSAIIGEAPLCASSSYYQLGSGDPPRTVLREEIPAIVEDYVKAAARAVEAGFDAIMLHYGHGYLTNSFMSPLTNHRKDEYGGSIENRMRFPLEIVAAIRACVGKDFPIIAKMTAEDGLTGGLELSESLEMGKMLETASLDCINVTVGIHFVMERMVQPMAMPRGCLVPYAKAFKDVLRIPVAAVGRINNPELAENILQNDGIDLIYLGRPLIADPFFPKKVIENRTGEIRNCIACNQGCHLKLLTNETITCFINPRVGKEKEIIIEPVKEPKEIAIIGGGPAGMQAALIAAQRGHKVSLYEKDSYLGGDLLLAGKPPKKEELTNLVQTMERQLRDLGVQIHLGQALSKEDVKALAPEAVIVALGAQTSIIPIDGVHLPHVFTAQDVLKDPAKVSGDVVVIGGGSTGCETAELLAYNGIHVTVIELLPTVAQDLESSRRKLLLESLSDMGVRLLVNAKVQKITEKDVVIDWRFGESAVPADCVILATGVHPRKDFEGLEELLGVPVHYAGSCVKAGAGIDAMHEGFEKGRIV